MKIGSRVSHPVFGIGTVIDVIQKSAFDNRSFGHNGVSRYNSALNIDVRFDDGGPRGFAEGATNDVSDLKEVL